MKPSAMAMVTGCLVLLSSILLAPPPSHGLDALIDVSPNVLNLESQGNVVTVHTDIAYTLVDVHTVYLNGIAIQSWKADDRGNFVAKFSMDEVKSLDGLVIGDDNLLQLVGLTVDGEPFAGEQEIRVIEVLPRGR